MLSEQQIIGVGIVVWAIPTFASFYVASGSKYQATPGRHASQLKQDLYQHAGSNLRIYICLGVFMYILLSAAITTYWWGMSPADVPSVSPQLYLWTVAGYVVMCVCKAASMRSVMCGTDVSMALFKCCLVTGISIFLVVSTAYSTANYDGDRVGDAIFPLVVFAVHAMWCMWLSWFIYTHKHMRCLHAEHMRAKGSYEVCPTAQPAVLTRARRHRSNSCSSSNNNS